MTPELYYPVAQPAEPQMMAGRDLLPIPWIVAVGLLVHLPITVAFGRRWRLGPARSPSAPGQSTGSPELAVLPTLGFVGGLACASVGWFVYQHSDTVATWLQSSTVRYAGGFWIPTGVLSSVLARTRERSAIGWFVASLIAPGLGPMTLALLGIGDGRSRIVLLRFSVLLGGIACAWAGYSVWEYEGRRDAGLPSPAAGYVAAIWALTCLFSGLLAREIDRSTLARFLSPLLVPVVAPMALAFLGRKKERVLPGERKSEPAPRPLPETRPPAPTPQSSPQVPKSEPARPKPQFADLYDGSPPEGYLKAQRTGNHQLPRLQGRTTSGGLRVTSGLEKTSVYPGRTASWDASGQCPCI